MPKGGVVCYRVTFYACLLLQQCFFKCSECAYHPVLYLWMPPYSQSGYAVTSKHMCMQIDAHYWDKDKDT